MTATIGSAAAAAMRTPAGSRSEAVRCVARITPSAVKIPVAFQYVSGNWSRSLLYPALVGNVAGSNRVSRATRQVAAIASATHRSSAPRRPGARACRPTNSSIRRYRRARSNSISARTGASDQPPESSVQTANSAKKPAITASERLHPEKGRSDRVTWATSSRHRTPTATPVVTEK